MAGCRLLYLPDQPPHVRFGISRSAIHPANNNHHDPFPRIPDRRQPGDIPDISGSAEDAVKFAESLGFGWNMGNHMDAWYTADGKEISSETCWGNKEATAETFKKVKEAGYASVRIPITWLGHIGAAPSYTIEEAWLNRVAQLVDWAEEAGLKVIINMHHDGANSEHWLDVKNAALDASVNEKIEAQFSAMWKQIAEKFKDKGNFLIFEPFNEIHDGGWGWGDNRTDGGKQYAIVNGWNQLFVNTVRATGGNNATRYLAVIGYDTDIELTIDNLKLPTDVVENRLIVGVHCYDPYLYTLENQFAQWGHVADSSLAPGDKESTLSNRMKKMKDAFVDKGIPVYFGEMGCSERDNETDEVYRRYYLHYFAKAARTYGFAAMVWDNGAEGGGRQTAHQGRQHLPAHHRALQGQCALHRFLADVMSSLPCRHAPHARRGGSQQRQAREVSLHHRRHTRRLS